MTKVAAYSWQIITGDGSCYNRMSKPDMSLDSWVSEGIAKRIVFQADGLPTVGFDVSRNTRIILNERIYPDPDYRDFDQTDKIKNGEQFTEQPIRHCQVIGYERAGLMVAMLIDLDSGSIDLIDGRTD